MVSCMHRTSSPQTEPTTKNCSTWACLSKFHPQSTRLEGRSACGAHAHTRRAHGVAHAPPLQAPTVATPHSAAMLSAGPPHRSAPLAHSQSHSRYALSLTSTCTSNASTPSPASIATVLTARRRLPSAADGGSIGLFGRACYFRGWHSGVIRTPSGGRQARSIGPLAFPRALRPEAPL